MTYIKKNGDIDWDAYNDGHRIVDGVHVPNCVGFARRCRFLTYKQNG